MPITNKNQYRGLDFNNQVLKDAKSLQLNQDAINQDEAPRLSQVETVSTQAAQDILIQLMSNASNDTAFTSLTTKGFLEGKQDNMEIDSSSSAYMQIVDGYKIKVKQLLITNTTVDETSGNLQDYINANNPTNQEGDVIFLNAATDNQKRSWIKTGSASQGVDGYVRLQTDYNVTSIRAMFDSGTFITYSSASGQFSVNIGNGSGQLGAHTLPISDASFASATGTNMLALAKSLEDLILNGQTTSSQATAAVDNRFSSCSGVSGNDLGNFGGRFSDESTIKDILVEAETDLTSSESDRTAIRSEFSAADTILQNNINAEVSARISAVSSEASSRIANDNALTNSLATTNNNLSNEFTRATTAEYALDDRLDIVEGGSNVNGSIAKAQADAQAFATSSVLNEATIRANADINLQVQIDAISSAFLYKGYVNADGRIVHIDPLHANNNALFENITLFNGDFYKVNADITITFNDNTTISVNIGDGLLGINDVVSGNVSVSDIHKTDNTESVDLLREGMLDNTTIEKNGGLVKIIDNSIGRTQLDNTIQTDIDNKLLKSGDIMTGALKIDKTVVEDTGYVGGYDYAAYVKQKSIDTASLTDTQRALLVENDVYSDGSGNPLDLDYANATTSASHYKGSSSNMTIATVGSHSEGSVSSSSAAVYATGAYGVATSTQLGVNAGGTFVAQNAATANLGVFAFSDTAGALNNRAAYFAISPDNVDLDAYRVARVASPLPIQDAALIVDDYTGTKHAAYFNGKVEINGDVVVPNASNDTHAVNLGDIKNKEKEFTVNIPALDSVTINHQFASKKIIFSLWLNDESVDDGFKVERTSTNSIKIYNNTTESVDGLEVLLYKFSI